MSDELRHQISVLEAHLAQARQDKINDDLLIADLRREYDEINNEYNQMRRDRNMWRQTLQQCTPGGSEFQTPEACLTYVQEAREQQHQVIIRFKRERNDAWNACELLERERDALKSKVVELDLAWAGARAEVARMKQEIETDKQTAWEVEAQKDSLVDTLRQQVQDRDHWIDTEKTLLCSLYGQLGNLGSKHDTSSFVSETRQKIEALLDQFSPWLKASGGAAMIKREN